MPWRSYFAKTANTMTVVYAISSLSGQTNTAQVTRFIWNQTISAPMAKGGAKNDNLVRSYFHGGVTAP